jgi:hypothetical protein
MRFEFNPFNESLKNGEFQEMFQEAFGFACAEGFSSSNREPQPEWVGRLFDNGVLVSFFSFKREKDFVLMIELGHLNIAAENRYATYFIEIIKKFHDLGYQNVVTEIPSTNRPGIISCLSIGFEIVGFRQTERKLLVQLNHTDMDLVTSGTKH